MIFRRFTGRKPKESFAKNSDAIPTSFNVSDDITTISKSGSCPKASNSFHVMDKTYTISYQPFCDLAGRLRPVVIAAARVTAAWLIIGAL